MAASTVDLATVAMRESGSDEEMATLWAVALLVEHGLVAIAEAVAECRRCGHSDPEIAEVLGVTKQAVQQRFPRGGRRKTHSVRPQSPGQESLPI
jgi:hypothetical protein